MPAGTGAADACLHDSTCTRFPAGFAGTCCLQEMVPRRPARRISYTFLLPAGIGAPDAFPGAAPSEAAASHAGGLGQGSRCRCCQAPAAAQLDASRRCVPACPQQVAGTPPVAHVAAQAILTSGGAHSHVQQRFQGIPCLCCHAAKTGVQCGCSCVNRGNTSP